MARRSSSRGDGGGGGGTNTDRSFTRVGDYELGAVLGQGHSAVVRNARHIPTLGSFAIKILDKKTVMRFQESRVRILREITAMSKIRRHPNIVTLHEVMATQTNIYMVLELVTGGELFDSILKHEGPINEAEGRKYFHQLITAVDYCHSRGIFHRDLKPENLLLTDDGRLKVADFGFSALSHHVREDGRLHTRCGTPHYTAPERITMSQIFEDPWFKIGYEPPKFSHDISESLQQSESDGVVKRETRFMSTKPPDVINLRMMDAAASMGVNLLRIKDTKPGRKGCLTIDTEVLEVDHPFEDPEPSPFSMVELRLASGDTLEFHSFYKEFRTELKDIIYLEEPMEPETDGASTSVPTNVAGTSSGTNRASTSVPPNPAGTSAPTKTNVSGTSSGKSPAGTSAPTPKNVAGTSSGTNPGSTSVPTNPAGKFKIFSYPNENVKNEEALTYQDASILHLPYLKSDHRPLLLRFKSDSQASNHRRPFRENYRKAISRFLDLSSKENMKSGKDLKELIGNLLLEILSILSSKKKPSEILVA
ncbi:hypothetical protein RJT34_03820 [Clitoria ternatea]|uniref:Protein kinase domain-containing protein n=1 Tax=Clitoria ternatea TaxID=43366 RepID=A0AAN9KKH3_CLITE